MTRRSSILRLTLMTLTIGMLATVLPLSAAAAGAPEVSFPTAGGNDLDLLAEAGVSALDTSATPPPSAAVESTGLIPGVREAATPSASRVVGGAAGGAVAAHAGHTNGSAAGHDDGYGNAYWVTDQVEVNPTVGEVTVPADGPGPFSVTVDAADPEGDQLYFRWMVPVAITNGNPDYVQDRSLVGDDFVAGEWTEWTPSPTLEFDGWSDPALLGDLAYLARVRPSTHVAVQVTDDPENAGEWGDDYAHRLAIAEIHTTNTVPTFDLPAEIVVRADDPQPYELEVEISDVDVYPVYASVWNPFVNSWLPNGAIRPLEAATYTAAIEWPDPSASHRIVSSLKLIAMDGERGHYIYGRVPFTILPALSNPPVVGPQDDVRVFVDDPQSPGISVGILASDDGPPSELQYRWKYPTAIGGTNSWTQWSSSSARTISEWPTTVTGPPGYRIDFEVRDADDQTTSGSLQFIVENRLPFFTSLPDYEVFTDQSGEGVAITPLAIDPDGGSVSYDFAIATPTNEVVGEQVGDVFVISEWPATAADFVITVTVTDDEGDSAIGGLEFVVSERPNTPPVWGTPAVYTVTAGAAPGPGGEPLVVSAVATDVEASAGDQQLFYSFFIPAALGGEVGGSWSAESTSRSIDITSWPGTPGTHTILATVTDSRGATPSPAQLEITVEVVEPIETNSAPTWAHNSSQVNIYPWLDSGLLNVGARDTDDDESLSFLFAFANGGDGFTTSPPLGDSGQAQVNDSSPSGNPPYYSAALEITDFPRPGVGETESYDVTLFVHDSSNAYAPGGSKPVEIIIHGPTNTAPWWSSEPGDLVLRAGETETVTFAASDSTPGDELSYVVSLPEDFDTDLASNQFDAAPGARQSFTITDFPIPGVGQSESHQIAISVEDAHGASAVPTLITVTVHGQAASEHPVWVDWPGALEVSTNTSTFPLLVKASDGDSARLTYTFTLPAGFESNGQTGQVEISGDESTTTSLAITAVPTVATNESATYPIVVSVRDAENNRPVPASEESKLISITVTGSENLSPTWATQPPSSRVIEAGSYQTLNFAATDGNGDQLTYLVGVPTGFTTDERGGGFFEYQANSGVPQTLTLRPDPTLSVGEADLQGQLTISVRDPLLAHPDPETVAVSLMAKAPLPVANGAPRWGNVPSPVEIQPATAGSLSFVATDDPNDLLTYTVELPAGFTSAEGTGPVIRADVPEGQVESLSVTPVVPLDAGDAPLVGTVTISVEDQDRKPASGDRYVLLTADPPADVGGRPEWGTVVSPLEFFENSPAAERDISFVATDVDGDGLVYTVVPLNGFEIEGKAAQFDLEEAEEGVTQELTVTGWPTIPADADSVSGSALISVIDSSDLRPTIETHEISIEVYRADPGDGDPGDGDPGDGEPGDGGPGDGEPGDGEPGDGEPGDGDPGDGDPDGVWKWELYPEDVSAQVNSPVIWLQAKASLEASYLWEFPADLPAAYGNSSVASIDPVPVPKGPYMVTVTASRAGYPDLEWTFEVEIVAEATNPNPGVCNTSDVPWQMGYKPPQEYDVDRQNPNVQVFAEGASVELTYVWTDIPSPLTLSYPFNNDDTDGDNKVTLSDWADYNADYEIGYRATDANGFCRDDSVTLRMKGSSNEAPGDGSGAPYWQDGNKTFDWRYGEYPKLVGLRAYDDLDDSNDLTYIFRWIGTSLPSQTVIGSNVNHLRKIKSWPSQKKTYTLEVTARDSSGNTSPPRTFTINIANVHPTHPPTVNWYDRSFGDSSSYDKEWTAYGYGVGDLQYSFTVLNNGQDLNWSSDGKTMTLSPPFTKGTYQVQVRVTNDAGSVTETATLNIWDTGGPSQGLPEVVWSSQPDYWDEDKGAFVVCDSNHDQWILRAGVADPFDVASDEPQHSHTWHGETSVQSINDIDFSVNPDDQAEVFISPNQFDVGNAPWDGHFSIDVTVRDSDSNYVDSTALVRILRDDCQGSPPPFINWVEVRYPYSGDDFTIGKVLLDVTKYDGVIPDVVFESDPPGLTFEWINEWEGDWSGQWLQEDPNKYRRSVRISGWESLGQWTVKVAAGSGPRDYDIDEFWVRWESNLPAFLRFVEPTATLQLTGDESEDRLATYAKRFAVERSPRVELSAVSVGVVSRPDGSGEPVLTFGSSNNVGIYPFGNPPLVPGDYVFQISALVEGETFTDQMTLTVVAPNELPEWDEEVSNHEWIFGSEPESIEFATHVEDGNGDPILFKFYRSGNLIAQNLSGTLSQSTLASLAPGGHSIQINASDHIGHGKHVAVMTVLERVCDSSVTNFDASPEVLLVAASVGEQLSVSSYGSSLSSGDSTAHAWLVEAVSEERFVIRNNTQEWFTLMEGATGTLSGSEASDQPAHFVFEPVGDDVLIRSTTYDTYLGVVDGSPTWIANGTSNALWRIVPLGCLLADVPLTEVANTPPLWEQSPVLSYGWELGEQPSAISATATDDGLPSGAFEYQWTLTNTSNVSVDTGTADPHPTTGAFDLDLAERPPLQAGLHTLTVVADDGDAQSAELAILIDAPNEPPSWNSASNPTVIEWKVSEVQDSVTVWASDDDGPQALVYEVTIDGTAYPDQSTGEVFLPDDFGAGAHLVEVRAYDGDQYAADPPTWEVTIDVTPDQPLNVAPTWLGDLQSEFDWTQKAVPPLVSATATDDDGLPDGTLVYHWDLDIAGVAPQRSGTVLPTTDGAFVADAAELGALGVGVHTLTVVADDGGAKSESWVVSLDVVENVAPEWDSATNPTSFSWTASEVPPSIRVTATDDDGPFPLVFGAQIESVSIPMNEATGDVFIPDGLGLGTHVIEVRAWDGHKFALDPFRWKVNITITADNQPPEWDEFETEYSWPANEVLDSVGVWATDIDGPEALSYWVKVNGFFSPDERDQDSGFVDLEGRLNVGENTVEVRVTDGDSSADPEWVTVTINVTDPTNVAPSWGAQTTWFTWVEGSPVPVVVKATDSDELPADGELSYVWELTGVGVSHEGTSAPNEAGEFVADIDLLDGLDEGSYTLAVVADDGDAQSSELSIGLTVTAPENESPVWDGFETEYSWPANEVLDSITVSATDPDDGPGALSYWVKVNNTFYPHEQGQDSGFVDLVGRLNPGLNTVEVRVTDGADYADPVWATVRINVTDPTNVAPSWGAQTTWFTWVEGSSVPVVVAASDDDLPVDGEFSYVWELTGVGVSHEGASAPNEEGEFAADIDLLDGLDEGSYTLAVVADDGDAQSSELSIGLTVTAPENERPVWVESNPTEFSWTVSEVPSSIIVEATDPDDGPEPLRYVININGTELVQAAGEIDLTDRMVLGPNTVDVRVNDGDKSAMDPFRWEVTIFVSPDLVENEPPVWDETNPTEFSWPANEVLDSITVSASDSDDGPGALSYWVKVNNTSYTHERDQDSGFVDLVGRLNVGLNTVEVRVTDGADFADPEWATVVITVGEPANVAPSWGAQTTWFTWVEGSSLPVVVKATDSDELPVDGELSYGWELTGVGVNHQGTSVPNEDGEFVADSDLLDGLDEGSYTLVVVADDGEAASPELTMVLAVTEPANVAPVWGEFETVYSWPANEIPSSITVSASDPDGGPEALSYWVKVNGSFYPHEQGQDSGFVDLEGRLNVGENTVEVRVTDGADFADPVWARVEITVTEADVDPVETNKRPVWSEAVYGSGPSPSVFVSADVGELLSVEVFAEDDQPVSELTYSFSGGISGSGTVALAGEQSSPVLDLSGLDAGFYEFTVLATDAGGLSTWKSLTVRVRVDALKIRPVWQDLPEELELIEGSSYTFVAIDDDEAPEPVSYRFRTTDGAYDSGVDDDDDWVFLNTTGIADFSVLEPDTYQLLVTASDGTFFTDPTWTQIPLTITEAPNQAPVWDETNPTEFSWSEDEVLDSITVSATDSDGGPEALSYWVKVNGSFYLEERDQDSGFVDLEGRLNVGENTVEVRVTDGESYADPEWKVLTVTVSVSEPWPFLECIDSILEPPSGIPVAIAASSATKYVQSLGTVALVPNALTSSRWIIESAPDGTYVFTSAGSSLLLQGGGNGASASMGPIEDRFALVPFDDGDVGIRSVTYGTWLSYNVAGDVTFRSATGAEPWTRFKVLPSSCNKSFELQPPENIPPIITELPSVVEVNVAPPDYQETFEFELRVEDFNLDPVTVAATAPNGSDVAVAFGDVQEVVPGSYLVVGAVTGYETMAIGEEVEVTITATDEPGAQDIETLVVKRVRFNDPPEIIRVETVDIPTDDPLEFEMREGNEMFIDVLTEDLDDSVYDNFGDDEVFGVVVNVAPVDGLKVIATNVDYNLTTFAITAEEGAPIGEPIEVTFTADDGTDISEPVSIFIIVEGRQGRVDFPLGTTVSYDVQIWSDLARDGAEEDEPATGNPDEPQPLVEGRSHVVNRSRTINLVNVELTALEDYDAGDPNYEAGDQLMLIKIDDMRDDAQGGIEEASVLDPYSGLEVFQARQADVQFADQLADPLPLGETLYEAPEVSAGGEIVAAFVWKGNGQIGEVYHQLDDYPDDEAVKSDARQLVDTVVSAFHINIPGEHGVAVPGAYIVDTDRSGSWTADYLVKVDADTGRELVKRRPVDEPTLVDDHYGEMEINPAGIVELSTSNHRTFTERPDDAGEENSEWFSRSLVVGAHASEAVQGDTLSQSQRGALLADIDISDATVLDNDTAIAQYEASTFVTLRFERALYRLAEYPDQASTMIELANALRADEGNAQRLAAAFPDMSEGQFKTALAALVTADTSDADEAYSTLLLSSDMNDEELVYALIVGATAIDREGKIFDAAAHLAQFGETSKVKNQGLVTASALAVYEAEQADVLAIASTFAATDMESAAALSTAEMNVKEPVAGDQADPRSDTEGFNHLWYYRVGPKFVNLEVRASTRLDRASETVRHTKFDMEANLDLNLAGARKNAFRAYVNSAVLQDGSGERTINAGLLINGENKLGQMTDKGIMPYSEGLGCAVGNRLVKDFTGKGIATNIPPITTGALTLEFSAGIDLSYGFAFKFSVDMCDIPDKAFVVAAEASTYVAVRPYAEAKAAFGIGPVKLAAGGFELASLEATIGAGLQFGGTLLDARATVTGSFMVPGFQVREQDLCEKGLATCAETPQPVGVFCIQSSAQVNALEFYLRAFVEFSLKISVFLLGNIVDIHARKDFPIWSFDVLEEGQLDGITQKFNKSYEWKEGRLQASDCSAQAPVEVDAKSDSDISEEKVAVYVTADGEPSNLTETADAFCAAQDDGGRHDPTRDPVVSDMREPGEYQVFPPGGAAGASLQTALFSSVLVGHVVSNVWCVDTPLAACASLSPPGADHVVVMPTVKEQDALAPIYVAEDAFSLGARVQNCTTGEIDIQLDLAPGGAACDLKIAEGKTATCSFGLKDTDDPAFAADQDGLFERPVYFRWSAEDFESNGSEVLASWTTTDNGPCAASDDVKAFPLVDGKISDQAQPVPAAQFDLGARFENCTGGEIELSADPFSADFEAGAAICMPDFGENGQGVCTWAGAPSDDSDWWNETAQQFERPIYYEWFNENDERTTGSVTAKWTLADFAVLEIDEESIEPVVVGGELTIEFRVDNTGGQPTGELDAEGSAVCNPSVIQAGESAVCEVAVNNPQPEALVDLLVSDGVALDEVGYELPKKASEIDLNLRQVFKELNDNGNLEPVGDQTHTMIGTSSGPIQFDVPVDAPQYFELRVNEPTLTVELTHESNLGTSEFDDFVANAQGTSNCIETTLTDGVCEFWFTLDSANPDSGASLLPGKNSTGLIELTTTVYPKGWKLPAFGTEQPHFVKFAGAGLRIEPEVAIVDGDPRIVATVTNVSQQYPAVDVQSITGLGGIAMTCDPPDIAVGESTTCTSDDSVEAGDTVTIHVGDDFVEALITYEVPALDPDDQEVEYLEQLAIEEIIAVSPGTESQIWGAPAGTEVDVFVTVKNLGPDTVRNLTFDLIGKGNGCDGFELEPGLSVRCDISGVPVVPGVNTHDVTAQGTTDNADVYSGWYRINITGEAPQIAIAEISSANTSLLNPTDGGELANGGLEEGSRTLSVTVRNLGAEEQPGATPLTNIAIGAAGISDVQCPATLAPGQSAECTASFDVRSTDAEVSRALTASAESLLGYKTSDQRTWSWSYQPAFTIEMLYSGQATPPARYVGLGVADVAFVLQGFAQGAELTAAGFNEADLVLVGGQPATCSTGIPATVAVNQSVVCSVVLRIENDETVIATATVDGVTKTAQLDLLVDSSVEIVDVGEQRGAEPSWETGTGTGGFVLSDTGPMPASLNLNGQDVSVETLNSWVDEAGTWHVEIVPPPGLSGALVVLAPAPEVPQLLGTFHIIPAGPDDELFNQRLVNVTDATISYERTGDVGNTVVVSDELAASLRHGSVLVHEGGPEAPLGFVQVVESFSARKSLNRGAGTTVTTRTGDLLDVFRKKKSRNSKSGEVSDGGAGVDGAIDFSLDFETSFTPEFDIDIDYGWEGWLPEANLLYARVGATASASITYNASASVNYSANGGFTILKDTRLLTFAIGPVPVTVNVAADGVWTVDAAGEMSVTGTIGAELTAWAEFDARRGAGMDGIKKDFEPTFKDCEDFEGDKLKTSPIGNTCFDPHFAASVTASAGVDAWVSLLIADTAGPSVAFGPRLTLSAGVTEDGVTLSAEPDFGGLGDINLDGQKKSAPAAKTPPTSPDTAGSTGLSGKSKAGVGSKLGFRFKGIAKKVFPDDLNLSLGTLADSILLTEFSRVFGVIVTLCAWGSGDFREHYLGGAPGPITRKMVVDYRPPGHRAKKIRWHGHHIVRKNAGENSTLQENQQVLVDNEMIVLSSCNNLVWAPNSKFTPGHHANTPVDLTYVDLNKDLQAVKGNKAEVVKVLDAWAVESCRAYIKSVNGTLAATETTAADKLCEERG